MTAASAAEDHELVAERGRVLVLERVVEARVPGIEQHRNADLSELNGKDGAEEAATSPSILGTEVRKRKPGYLSEGVGDTAHNTSPSLRLTDQMVGSAGTYDPR